jgi:hypothetical protein
VKAFTTEARKGRIHHGRSLRAFDRNKGNKRQNRKDQESPSCILQKGCECMDGGGVEL